MSRHHNPAGWDVIAGSLWQTVPDISPAARSLAEARRPMHFDPGREISTGDAWQIDCHLFNGGLFALAGGAWKPRPPGIWHLLAPGTRYVQDTRQAPLPLHALWVRFTGGERLGLLRIVSRSTGFARFHDPNGVILARVRAMTRIAESRGDQGYLDVMSELFSVLQLILDASPGPGHTYEVRADQPTAPDRMIQEVRDFIGSRFLGPLSRADIARHVRTGIDTIERRYRAAMGESLMRTVMRLRIDRTKELLRNGASVKEAAEAAGFCDAFHLSKTFRRYEGTSPSTYARLQGR